MPKITIDTKGITIDGRRIPIVSQEEGERADAVVCGDPDTPTPWADNVRTNCGWCAAPIIHRPTAPRRPVKICIPCALRTRQ